MNETKKTSYSNSLQPEYWLRHWDKIISCNELPNQFLLFSTFVWIMIRFGTARSSSVDVSFIVATTKWHTHAIFAKYEFQCRKTTTSVSILRFLLWLSSILDVSHTGVAPVAKLCRRFKTCKRNPNNSFAHVRIDLTWTIFIINFDIDWEHFDKYCEFLVSNFEIRVERHRNDMAFKCICIACVSNGEHWNRSRIFSNNIFELNVRLPKRTNETFANYDECASGGFQF